MKEKMITPKVKFKLPTVEEENQTIFDFCYHKSSGGWDWSEYVYKQHPKLKEMVGGVNDEKEFFKLCHEYVENYLEENREVIEDSRNKFQKVWMETEEEFLKNISKDFETDFPEEVKEIRASVSINPICPRYLDEWSFNVFYKFPEDRMKQTSIHEIIHFLYFKKWLEVFPNYDKRKFNGPHSEWKLSEILVNPIINNNETIQKIINNMKSNGYKEFQDIIIENKTLNEYFGDFYKEHLEGKTSFADFLKKSWDEYRKYKDVIEKANN